MKLFRYDPIHSIIQYSHRDLRHDVVHYLPQMFRNGLFIERDFRNAHGSPQQWQNRMARVGVEVDHVFIQIASELLGREIVLYPVITEEGQQDRVTISPSSQTNHEPYHILLYDEAHFASPHYQSVRPQNIEQYDVFQENSEIPQQTSSMFSRLTDAVNNRDNTTRYILSNFI